MRADWGRVGGREVDRAAVSVPRPCGGTGGRAGAGPGTAGTHRHPLHLSVSGRTHGDGDRRQRHWCSGCCSMSGKPWPGAAQRKPRRRRERRGVGEGRGGGLERRCCSHGLMGKLQVGRRRVQLDGRTDGWAFSSLLRALQCSTLTIRFQIAAVYPLDFVAKVVTSGLSISVLQRSVKLKSDVWLGEAHFHLSFTLFSAKATVLILTRQIKCWVKPCVRVVGVRAWERGGCRGLEVVIFCLHYTTAVNTLGLGAT